MEGRLVKGQIGVIGGAECSPEIYEIAREVGREIAKNGFSLVCGGLGGVMEAACRGAKEGGGITIGILPTDNKRDANPYVDLIIPTGLSHARNVLVVHASDALVAVDGEAGTLSEIAIALKVRKPIVGIRTWELDGRVPLAKGGRESVAMLMDMLR
ncbi:MAG: TIGR00725 family protein [Deltaproteobacteria bacterium RBG_13_52_11]|nr:MAG: TIGR00725 family protein [Deltaproteobacteria bacterium RBG_13_52_11]